MYKLVCLGKHFPKSNRKKKKTLSGSMSLTMTPPTRLVVKMMKKCQLFKTE